MMIGDVQEEKVEPDTQSILNKLRNQIGIEESKDKQDTGIVPETKIVKAEEFFSNSNIKLEDKDIRIFYEFVSDFLKSRGPKWEMSDKEIDNFTLLTVKLGEKYSSYYVQYSLEGAGVITLILFIMKRLNQKE